MKIKYIDGFGWCTKTENVYENMEICLAEREIAVKYWSESYES